MNFTAYHQTPWSHPPRRIPRAASPAPHPQHNPAPSRRCTVKVMSKPRSSTTCYAHRGRRAITKLHPAPRQECRHFLKSALLFFRSPTTLALLLLLIFLLLLLLFFRRLLFLGSNPRGLLLPLLMQLLFLLIGLASHVFYDCVFVVFYLLLF